MKTKIEITIFDYLQKNLSIERPDLIEFIKSEMFGNKANIEINDDIASEIRDWAGSKLQKVGFDENYELTSDGKILEEIIDLFYC